ncbi:hypothetical protein [Sphaerisporangium aureirubrum]|uniref:Uncharacterized protein n=1 Tax=Sphaerisporangium aureirubrum TaxID=1544736 RepID=A0ABW1NCB8_9ACTN
MRDLDISFGSRPWLHLPFTKVPQGVTLTTLPVRMAITPYTQAGPAGGDWLNAEWTPGASPPAARILIGPGTSRPLARGTYVLWGEVTASPTLLVLESRRLVRIT